jgi:pimeloyl-ACP methyl ester carboxylesterase
MMNSGLLNVPLAVSLADMDASKDLLGKVHTPVLYILGGESDVAWVNAVDDFQWLDKVPVFFADLKGVGHGGTYWEPNGGAAARVVVAWLDWQLRGDARAGRMFTGKDCGLCRDGAWAVRRKGIE